MKLGTKNTKNTVKKGQTGGNGGKSGWIIANLLIISIGIALFSFHYSNNLDYKASMESILKKGREAKIALFGDGLKRMTREELALYDGRDETGGKLYLAIKGKIFDVTSNPKSYGKKGSYHSFVGKDATRAFLDLCFTPECLSRGWEDLTEQQLKDVDGWVSFYEKDGKYPFVGYVIN
eukprot:TRINITY_DN7885_c0_g1_i1.p1 TRINITY_DN7885_c0_g1~~TRINITY_DN7885_c0_g1_i1.p1  ORF type:complete len:178 (-),score=74.06 TRINITY_DN7885_c0_g1_i1:8-541(-)